MPFKTRKHRRQSRKQKGGVKNEANEKAKLLAKARLLFGVTDATSHSSASTSALGAGSGTSANAGALNTKKKFIEHPLSFINNLVHGTSYESAVDIIKQKTLIPHPGVMTVNLNGIPTTINKGIYLQAFFECSKDKTFTQEKLPFAKFPVNFVFNSELLNYYDNWYLSNDWIGGITFPPLNPQRLRKNKNGNPQNMYHSYNKSSLNQYIEKYYDTICSATSSPFVKNEVVFQNPIDLFSWLQRVYIYDYENLTYSRHTRIKNNQGKESVSRTSYINEETPLEKQTKLRKILDEVGLTHIPIVRIKNSLKEIF